jgi:ribose transport system permease protein
MVTASEKSRKISMPSLREWSAFARNNASTILIYGLVILVGGSASILSETFRHPANLISILRQSIILGLASIGQSIVVLTGGIDMSIGLIARIVALTVATFFGGQSTLILPMVLLGLGLGAVIGGINGTLVTRTHANPFIITFGMASILRAINLAIATDPIRGIPTPYLQIYDATVGILPINVIVMGLVWIGAWLITARTRFGRALFAVGGSERVARLSAINVSRTQVLAYAASGICGALVGLFVLSRTGVGDPNTAEGLEFQSIVAVALGGIRLYGGKGSIIGTLGGVLLLAIVSNVFNILQVSVFYQQLMLGLIVLIAVAAYKSSRSV